MEQQTRRDPYLSPSAAGGRQGRTAGWGAAEQRFGLHTVITSKKKQTEIGGTHHCPEVEAEQWITPYDGGQLDEKPTNSAQRIIGTKSFFPRSAHGRWGGKADQRIGLREGNQIEQNTHVRRNP